jgi:O-antigen/teichoic acid export membrane protein
LIGTGIGLGLLNMSDRFLVDLLIGGTGLSVYSANYSIASVVFAMLMAGVMRGVYPQIIAGYSRSGVSGALPLLNRATELYVLFALPSAFGLSALADRISALLFERPEYAAGTGVGGIVAFAMFFWGLSEYSNKAFELEGNTKNIFVYSMSAAALNILLNLLTLKRFGFYAAAVNTLLAFLFYFVLSYTGARKQFVFKLGAKLWGVYIGASALCGIAARFVSTLFANNLLAVVLGVLAGMLAYAAVLLISGRAKKLFSGLSK